MSYNKTIVGGVSVLVLAPVDRRIDPACEKSTHIAIHPFNSRGICCHMELLKEVLRAFIQRDAGVGTQCLCSHLQPYASQNSFKIMRRPHRLSWE